MSFLVGACEFHPSDEHPVLFPCVCMICRQREWLTSAAKRVYKLLARRSAFKHGLTSAARREPSERSERQLFKGTYLGKKMGIFVWLFLGLMGLVKALVFTHFRRGSVG